RPLRKGRPTARLTGTSTSHDGARSGETSSEPGSCSFMGPMTGTRLAHGDGSVLLLPPVLVLVDVAALARGGGLLLGFLRGRGRLRDRGRCGSGRGRGGRGGRGRVGTASEQLAQLLQVRLDAVALAVELLDLLLGG